MSNKLIMESWRKFVSETPESGEYLNEQELEEIFGKAAWEKLVDVWAETDAENTEQFTKQGLSQLTTDNNGNPLSPEQISVNVKTALAAAAETKDPEAIEAATDMAKVADEQEPGLNLDTDPVIKKAITADADAPAGESPKASGGLQLDRPLLMNVVKNPDAKVGPAMVFRTRLTKYLQSVGLPRTINRMSPVVQGIVNIVRQAALTANPSLGSTNLPAMGGDAGSPSLSANLEESIEKIFVPIIVEEAKREKTRRVLFEIAQMVAK